MRSASTIPGRSKNDSMKGTVKLGDMGEGDFHGHEEEALNFSVRLHPDPL